MTTNPNLAPEDFRAPTTARRMPRAVADAEAGVIIAIADIDGAPEAVFRALTTDEVERWWAMPGEYRSTDWKADLRACGAWSVVVVRKDGAKIRACGEFAELAFPHKIVMTRTFDAHPFQGPRETTITYRLERTATGTRVTVRDEGFIGRSEAAHGNAEIWERVLGWLDAYVAANRGAERPRVVLGRHSAVIVPRSEQARIRAFYCGVLGCTLVREREGADDIRMGDDFYIGFLYSDHATDHELLRSGRSVWLELASNDVDRLAREILAFGVEKLPVPDPHLYFQAPGGQVLRLVGIGEDLTMYEGNGHGPNVVKLQRVIATELTAVAP